MRRASMLAALGVTTCTLLTGHVRAASEADLEQVLAKVGAAVERYYARAQSVMCLETVTQQTLTLGMQPDGTPMRRLLYDLRVAWDALTSEDHAATVQRELLKVNNREPRPKDKPKCLDPSAVSPDSLTMLLPANRDDYIFTLAGSAKISGRAATLVDYKARQRGTVTVKPHEDREECWSIDMAGSTRGRVWIDAATGDVLRFDERLANYVEAALPSKEYGSQTVVFERLDSTTVYQPVTFADPDETLMLPTSHESLQLVRNAGTPGLRSTHKFSNYRRFSTEGHVIDPF
ncbi:MAG: hypothetical protein LBQ09_00095 [Acidobacteriaceae bacterium]|jgi:hypothetical protein|nr:hypothetical protein [Acidobacteriaceae bacterium]